MNHVVQKHHKRMYKYQPAVKRKKNLEIEGGGTGHNLWIGKVKGKREAGPEYQLQGIKVNYNLLIYLFTPSP